MTAPLDKVIPQGPASAGPCSLGDCRYVTPLGDRREHPVPCAHCHRLTFALDAVCDGCTHTEVSQ